MKIAIGSFLRQELEKRQARNTKYSVRAFAKKLEISPATLSRILSGKQVPTAEVTSRICKKLELSAKVSLALQESTRRSKQPHILDTDAFLKIIDIHHYALLNLLMFKKFKYDFAWMGRTLNLSQAEVQEMWNRLVDVGLIMQDESGRWVRTHGFTSNARDKKVAAQRSRDLHIQILEKAVRALKNESPERHGITAITLAINSKMLPAARKKIERFKMELAAFMESDDPDQVYTLSVAFYPHTSSET